MSSWTLDPASVRRSPEESTESAHRQGLGTNLSDDVAQARSQRLLSDAKAALRFALTLRDSRSLQHNALHRYHFNPNQPRVPMGNPDGGQWTSMGARNDPRVILDTNPDEDWKPGAQYAQVTPPPGRPPKIPEQRPSSRGGRAHVIQEVVNWLREHGDQIIEAASWLDEFYPSIRSYFDPPKTLQELQEAVTTPEKGYDTHHIVEQTSAEQDGFPRSLIDAHNNGAHPSDEALGNQRVVCEAEQRLRRKITQRILEGQRLERTPQSWSRCIDQVWGSQAMKRINLSEVNVEQLVEGFAAVALEQDDAILMHDNARFTRLFWQMEALEEELKARNGDQRQALLRLYHHPNVQVRLTAARATLAVAPDAARRLLRSIADSKEYPQAGDAGMSLVNLDRGIFKPT